MNQKLKKIFANPGSEFRGAPFWAWNGKLEPEELRRQIRVMNRMGLGGFFMHSRVGLDTAYLSDDWFECIEACIDEADKLDMQAWLYDEDRWPSGAAGGLVTRNPEYRARMIYLDEIAKPADLQTSKTTLGVFRARVDGKAATDVKRVNARRLPRQLAGGEVLLHFHVVEQSPSSWYNGQAYLDLLSHKAVKEFIRVTHKAYEKRIGRKLGKRVPGIFTDEPNYMRMCQSQGEARTTAPWTGQLPAVFKTRYGYDLLPHLPEIFFNVDGKEVSQARYHYMDCVTFLFVDAFARQIGDWCDRTKMQHTGHMLEEDTLSRQTNCVGSCMRSYEHMQAPGMDLLTEHSPIYDTAKQVSSAARQFGRKWRLTETYGCTGWDFPFMGHKALGDWQAALGINLRAQHLSWYTMEGQAKRDYPAGIFYQSPWWEHYSKVEDYFARINAAMTQGKEVRDLLVIHPVESMWLQIGKGWREDPATGRMDREFMLVRESLRRANIDFDYGDEDILARHAKVSRKTLRVAKARYQAVLVPPMTTMRRTTLDLLKRFKKAGGLVVFAGAVPEYVDALPCSCVREFAAGCKQTPASGKKPAAAVEQTCRRISITTPDGKQIQSTLYLLREDRNNMYLFVCNTGHKPSQLPVGGDPTLVRDRTQSYPEVLISGFAGCAGAPVELDPDTGEHFAADARRIGDGWQLRTSLPAIGSRLFVVPKKASKVKLPQRPALQTQRTKTLASNDWDYQLSEENVLVLDRPRYKIGKGKWQQPNEILLIDREIREALDIPGRGGRMVQPWAREKKKNPKTVAVELDYTFEIKAVPKGVVYLGIERPDSFAITVNGNSLSPDADCGWWCDRSLRKLAIDPATLKRGANRIRVHCDYPEDHPGLEIVYLLGQFGTKLKGAEVSLTALPDKLKIGDWCKQGLTFYSGSVSYGTTLRPKLKKGERLVVAIPAYRGVGVRLLVDGAEAGIVAWDPHELDITELVADRKSVELRVEVLGHRRNSHGPHHFPEQWPRWTGPGQYVVHDKAWIDKYQLVPCGLMKPPQLQIRK